MIRSVASVVSALASGVANSHQTFLPVSSIPSIHSVRRVFPSTAGSQLSSRPAPFQHLSATVGLPLAYALSQRPNSSRSLVALAGNPLTVSAVRGRELTHRSFTPAGSCIVFYRLNATTT